MLYIYIAYIYIYMQYNIYAIYIYIYICYTFVMCVFSYMHICLYSYMERDPWTPLSPVWGANWGLETPRLAPAGEPLNDGGGPTGCLGLEGDALYECCCGEGQDRTPWWQKYRGKRNQTVCSSDSKGKGRKDAKSCRTRATLVLKAWCSVKVVPGRRDARLDSASSLCEDLWRSSCARSPGQVLCHRISEQDLCSLHQVSGQDLHKRSTGNISVQVLSKSSVGKISVRGLLARSLNKLSIRSLLARSLYKLLIRGLLARCLHQHPKCTWTCHKSHLCREFTGTMSRCSRNAYGQSEFIRAFFGEIYSANAGS